ncbi:hypothetical protein P7C73_g2967, partial [Tremellales sp. Uapishka_1]
MHNPIHIRGWIPEDGREREKERERERHRQMERERERKGRSRSRQMAWQLQDPAEQNAPRLDNNVRAYGARPAHPLQGLALDQNHSEQSVQQWQSAAQDLLRFPPSPPAGSVSNGLQHLSVADRNRGPYPPYSTKYRQATPRPHLLGPMTPTSRFWDRPPVAPSIVSVKGQGTVDHPLELVESDSETKPMPEESVRSATLDRDGENENDSLSDFEDDDTPSLAGSRRRASAESTRRRP